MFALIIIGVIVLAVFIGVYGTRNKNSSNHNKPVARTIRCPNCGSPAKVIGDHWECGWCGDYGTLR